MMNKRKNKLDEMQEQKLLKIERNGMWFAFWGLFLAILIQLAMDKEFVFRNILGEFIVFICLDIYILIACIKNGIWDRKLEPNIKNNIIISLLSGVGCGGFFFVSSYLKYQKLLGSIATGIFMLSIIFILTFTALTLFAGIYKKRVKKIESDCDNDN